MSRRGGRLVALGAVGLALVALLPGAAAADPGIESARARAQALSADVAELEQQAEVATEDLNAVQDRLGRVVTAAVSASERLGDLTLQARDERATTTRRVRALYMSGGSAGLYASVLRAGDISEALTRADVVGRVLRADRVGLGRTQDELAEVTAVRAELDQLAAERTRLEQQARETRALVEDLLGRRRSELAAASALVVRLVEEERARAAAAAAARAAASLATAADAPQTLPPGTPAVVVAAVTAARSRLGVPYVYAATGPDSFDCSGLTQWAYRQAGVALPRTSRQQWWVGAHPSLAELLPGDLLYWATDLANPATIHHVALYIGDGYMIHAPRTGDVVRVARVYLDGYIGATRPWGAAPMAAPPRV